MTVTIPVTLPVQDTTHLLKLTHYYLLSFTDNVRLESILRDWSLLVFERRSLSSPVVSYSFFTWSVVHMKTWNNFTIE